MAMTTEQHLIELGWTMVYVVIGMIIFGVAFAIISKVTPFSIRKEIEDDQNTALAVIIGAVMISLGIIVAAGISS
jgi:uncharacterized membrane protein YjfL (UPF0719 family)